MFALKREFKENIEDSNSFDPTALKERYVFPVYKYVCLNVNYGSSFVCQCSLDK